MEDKLIKCCNCGAEIEYINSNNPFGILDENGEPVEWKPEDRCCNLCNAEAVIPGRIRLFKKAGEKR